MKKFLILITSLILFLPFSKASHIVGGDISVKWIGPSQNDFQVRVRVFRSCGSGSATMPTSVGVELHDLVTYATTTTYNITNPVINANLPFGDPCFTPVGLCVDEGIFTQNVTIPNNPNGYFLSYQICCRNAGITNISNPSGIGMTFYCEIPDPGNAAAINNSNPDMGEYPLDAYLCVNSPKLFQFDVTDVDGDSLYYSLVTPLGDGFLNTAPTFPYNDVTYAGGYSLANMVGGVTPMTINNNTGVMIAAPSLIGTWVFGVLVEEFRNGVKIGETRIDAQYESQACTSGNPPSFLNTVPTMNQTIEIPYNKLYCLDLIFNDLNVTDTLFIEMISNIFDSGAYVPAMIPDINGNYHYFYDWNGSSWNDSVVIPPNQYDPIVGADWNIGTVANRFCWTPTCTQIDQTYPFQVNAFSLGCDGKTQDSVLFNIKVIPPPLILDMIGDITAPYGIETCQDLSFYDTSIVDMLVMDITSEIFSMGASFPTLANDYLYNGSVVTNVPNNTQNTVALGSRFCWTPGCEHIGKNYNVRAILSSVDCPVGVVPDTINFNVTVIPPFDSLDVVPNVITPNGDGLNDVYTLGYLNKKGERVGGVSNPCNDGMQVQIFNRWGLLVFESETNPIFEWDGKNKGGGDVPSGTYFVLIHGIYGSETVTLDQRTVTVLR